MSDLVDLHVHSDRSCDGDFSPAELAAMARKKGYRAISIADHDTVDAYPEAVEAGEKEAVEVIPGVELTTLFKGREFHLLLPFVDWTSPTILKIIAEQNERRLAEARQRVDKIRRLGFDVTWEEVDAGSRGAPPLGVKIAQVIVDKPENRSRLGGIAAAGKLDQAPYLFYREYFAESKPAYVPKDFIGLRQALELAPETGGIPVLAHPGAYFEMANRLDLEELKAAGLIGLEVYTSYHTKKQVRYYLGLAEELDLVPTAGSDFHGRIKPHVRLGDFKEGGYWMVEKLKERAARKQ